MPRSNKQHSNKQIAPKIISAVIGSALLVLPCVAQERTVPTDAPSPTSGEPKKSDWDSPDVVHPTPFGASSRGLNNVDPSIVPFEGEMPGPLGSQSREIKVLPDGTGPTIYRPAEILGGDSRSIGGRVVGTIYQMSDGQLRFMMRPGLAGTLGSMSREDRSFQGGKRGSDAGTGTETADEPVMVGGAYNQPLGYGSREDRSFQGGKRGSDAGTGTETADEPVMVGGAYNQPPGRGPGSLGGSADPYAGFADGKPAIEIKLSEEEISQLISNSRALEDGKTTAPYSEEGDASNVPAALADGERPIDYQVSHIHNLTEMTIHFQARWGTGPWKNQSVKPNRDRTGWNLPTNGIKQLWVRFDSDPGPGVKMVTYRVRTFRNPTTVINQRPTEVFVQLPNGLIDLRRNRP